MEPDGAAIRTTFCIAILSFSLSASAQEWSELATLIFTPAGSEVGASFDASVAPTAFDATRVPPQPAVGQADADLLVGQIRSRLGLIRALEAELGENAPELVDDLLALADLYEQSGDHADAVAALERAQQIIRMEDGLYSLEQVGLVERMIDNYAAATPGPSSSAGLEAYLAELVQRNPGDPRNVKTLTGVAERQMEAARHYLVNGVPPELSITMQTNFEASWGRFEPPRTARYFASAALRRARSSFGAAMQAALGTESPDIPLLLELEDDILNTYYFELLNPGILGTGFPYRTPGMVRFGGLNVLQAKLENSRRWPGTPVAIASAIVELADWHLLFSNFGHAVDEYERARAYLLGQGADARTVAELFSPDTPLELPAFAPDLRVRGGAGEVRGYIDVEVEINRYGGVRQMKILEHSPNATSAVERRLRRHLYQGRFRPRFVDGEIPRTDRFATRYYFSYSRS